MLCWSDNDDNNDDDFLYANILEDRAQWRDKIKGLSNLAIIKTKMRIPQGLCGNRESSDSSFHFHPRNVKRVTIDLL